MKPREILSTTTTPDGETLELSCEADGHFMIRVGGIPLMGSARSGSEEAMAEVARDALGPREGARVLIGGLGMGFTLRAALRTFGPDARITVAELLPQIVEYNRGVLADVAGRPLESPRVTVFAGDVRDAIARAGWDAILLDVDNGPEALTAKSNAGLYDDRGVASLARALTSGGVAVIWSSKPARRFEQRLRRAGLRCEIVRVHARTDVKKGGRHILFVAKRS